MDCLRIWIAVAVMACIFNIQVQGKSGGAGSSGAASGPPLSATQQMELQEVKQIVIMVTPEHPPFANFSSTTGLTGFDIDFINAVCGETDIECPIVTAPYSSAWTDSPMGYMGTGLLRRDFDCAASSGITTPRNSTLLFSQPYTKPEVGIIIERKAFPVGTGAVGHRVGVVTTSSCNSAFASARLPQARLIAQVSDSRALITALKGQVVDAALICGWAQAMAVIDNATLQVAPQRLHGASAGLAFMCHPRLAYQVRQLDLAMLSLRSKNSGIDLTQVCHKYPGVDCEYSGFSTGGASSSVASRRESHTASIVFAYAALVWLLVDTQLTEQI